MSEYYADNMKDVAKPPYQGKALAQGQDRRHRRMGNWRGRPAPAGYAQHHTINSVNKNDKMQLSCDITRTTGTGIPSEDEVFEACKTIQFAK